MSTNLVLCLIQWTFLSLIFSVTAGGKEIQLPHLVIEPLTTRKYGVSPIFLKKVQDPLNLTCSVVYDSLETEPKYNISWVTPLGTLNSQNRVIIESDLDSANLFIQSLDPRDKGEYICNAYPINGNESLQLLSENVIVNVKPRNKLCGETQFSCSSSKHVNCISRRYRCDGHQDCENGEDEDTDICGKSACSNKWDCESTSHTGEIIVRCIPKSWCCNARFDPNCTVREPLSCCPQKSYPDDRSYLSTHQPHMSEVNFLQTTIYTVIGCAMVFMIVVTVLVIAICRVHMKRSLLTTHCPPHVQPPHNPNTSFYDIDLYLNRGCLMENYNTPGFLVTYNINNGVQIVGHAVDPPPYSEVVPLPPREGPPPPYSSHEALETEALLHQPNTNTSDVRVTEERGEPVTGATSHTSDSEPSHLETC